MEYYIYIYVNIKYVYPLELSAFCNVFKEMLRFILSFMRQICSILI